MYFDLIIEDDSLKSYVALSKHPLRTGISHILSSATDFIKSADVDDDLIATSIEWITKDIDGFKAKIDKSIIQLSQLAPATSGKLVDRQTVEYFEDSHVPPFYIALWLVIQSVNILESQQVDEIVSDDDQEMLVSMANTLGAIRPLDLLTNTMLSGEFGYYSRLSGAQKSGKKRKEKSPLKMLVASLAEKVWARNPKLSANSVANLIHYRIREQLTNWPELGCQWFVRAKLFDEIEMEMVKVNGVQTSEPEKDYRFNGVISDEDPTKMLVPVKMPGVDAIRAQISPIKSSKGRQTIKDSIRKDIEAIIDEEILCTDKDCPCNSNL